MKNKLNVGIIGRNFGLKVIYKSIQKNKKFNTIGICFKSKNIKNLKIPKSIKIYNNWKKMIIDKNINAIIIASPPYLHKKIIKFALKHKKHIFCEKPFTTTFNDAAYLCKILEKNKNICHMVNYEFINIEAFNYLKKKILNNCTVKKVHIDWYLKTNNRNSSNWKEQHKKGGGIFFNYICHSLYYIEKLFGEIKEVKNKFINKNLGLNSVIRLKNNKTKVLLKFKFIGKNSIMAPVNKIKIFTNKKNYMLKTNINSLSDQFSLSTRNKILFYPKFNKNDFRINPTKKNLLNFLKNIKNGIYKSPNFYDAKKIHFIINKMILSSQKNKNILINY